MSARLRKNLLARLEQHTPGWVRAIQSQVLLNISARGFGMRRRPIRLRTEEQALREYAAFTIASMMRDEADPAQLYREAYRAGRRIRRLSGLTEKEDLERLVFYLYKNIRITMTGGLPGQITVADCYFSQYYTPVQCAVMSNVDAGIITGICGGETLVFSERITEGCGRCRACLKEGSNTL